MINFSNIFKGIFWERNIKGENWYMPLENGQWCGYTTNLEMAQNHPILTPALLFVSKVFSQARFKVMNVRTGKEVETHKLLDLLNKPNFYQNRVDFLEALMFMQIANGSAALYQKKIIGMNDVDSLYLLDTAKIKFPESFKTLLAIKAGKNEILDTIVKYEDGNTNLEIKLKDILFFYDMPQGTKTDNIYQACSRLDGLKQTLINTNDSLTAKNIILKSNGKELITGERAGFPLDDDEKRDAENMFGSKYGLGFGRKRALITKATLNWKSLHIALRDLGLDESVKVDGNMIFTALHIPKDILSLEAKKTTYENGKQSMISYIQNEMQSSIDAYCAVFNDTDALGKNEILVGSYDHLPVMQYVNKEKYESEKIRAEALQALTNAGMPDDVALELLGFDKTVILKKPEKPEQPVASATQP
jgi:HK97 family phage portal protein